MTFQRISHPTFSTSPGCSAPHIQQQGQRCRPNLSLRLGLSLENSSATPGTENLAPVYQQHLSMMGQHDVSSPETQRQCMRSASESATATFFRYSMIKYVLFSMACIFGAEQVHLETRNTYNIIYIYPRGRGFPGGEGVGWVGILTS